MGFHTVTLFVLFGVFNSSRCFFVRPVKENDVGRLRIFSSEIRTILSEESDISLQQCRRDFGKTCFSSASALAAALTQFPSKSFGSVGTLPEFNDTNAILQGITIDVADSSQNQAMISFLEDGFDCKVLRKRISGTLEETWLGFGPEQLSVPSGFQLPVSSFAQYGGHSSIHLRYDSKSSKALYTSGEPAPGDNIAFLQLGVPGYRISQMVKNGGNILDAYGIVNVVSPSGLPIRGIVGIAPDPIMFLAINCVDVKASQQFYESLGFMEQEYPYARPSKGTGQFEPPQPKKSVYMAPSKSCLGILLLPSKRKKLTINPVIQSLNIVYQPKEGTEVTAMPVIQDPSGVGISFQSSSDFEKEEKETR